MTGDVNKLLEQLAEGFNTTVDKLYPILYKQAIVDGILNIVWIAVLAIGLIAVYKVATYIEKKRKECEDGWGEWDWDEPRQIAFIVVAGVFSIAALIAIAVNINNAVVALGNPDFYILRYVLSQFK